ncbi:hypothetical protein KFL_004530100 [Klebsormidium nitens]|uniref:YqaJ viral recombinase domain-containing protein n=1 Tax=Klebsormidium nitens TaxID=105231 RepID=A0A1Y1ICM4_KLENI|nr:hypothetical protein KFL_004530100 [Klebsormidium nitens]|eukprot:GAQ88705.1 hypothetical protein KFL_004530100 [Klebsormidium nitens]
MNTVHWLLAGALLALAILALHSLQISPARYSFTFYHLPGCKYCEEAMPAWRELQRIYWGPAVLRKVNAMRAKEEVNGLGIDGLSAYVLFDGNTGFAYKYEGARTAQAFSRFLAETFTEKKRRHRPFVGLAEESPRTASGSQVERLVQRYKTKMQPIAEGEGGAAYTRNKSDVRLCVPESLEERDVQTGLFVALHELAHIANVSWGHDQSFWDTFRDLLRLAVKARIYKKRNYKHDPARFCGGRGLTPRPVPNIEAARHGLLYEKEAIQRFQEITGIRVLDVGHVVHERFDWLSCVPDGITVDGRVAEIKCPYYRRIVPGVPNHCVKQLQIAMEVTDLDEAILVQYKPASVFGVEEIMISTLARDRTWIHRNWSRLHKKGQWLQPPAAA